MAQSRGQRLIDQLPDVDLVIGTQKFHRAADYLDDILAGRRDKIVDVAAETGSEAAIREHLLNGNAGEKPSRPLSASCRAATSIAPSASCPTPAARSAAGPSRTSWPNAANWRARRQGNHLARPDRHQLRQARHPVTDGRSAFVQLLEAVHEIEGLERIRFTSPHPKGYGDDLVEAYGRLPKLCESAHLPAQSGSDRVLKAMHRGYTRARFLDIVENCAASGPPSA